MSSVTTFSWKNPVETGRGQRKLPRYPCEGEKMNSTINYLVMGQHHGWGERRAPEGSYG